MKKLFFSGRLLGGEAHFFFWKMVTRVIGLGNTFLILSSLTVYQYGVLQLLLSLYAMSAEFTSPAGASIANDIQRFVGARNESRAKRLFLEQTALRAVIAACFFAIFFIGASVLTAYYKEDFTDFFRIIAFFFFTEFILLTIQNLLSTRLAFRAIASRTAVRKAVQFGILLVLVLNQSLGTAGVLASLALASLASSVFLIPAALRAYRPWRQVTASREWVITRIFAAHGKWEVVRTTFHGVVSNAHPWAIKLFIGTEAVGIYNAALALADVFKGFIVSRTMETLLPHVSSERERLRLIFRNGTKYLAALGVGVAIFGAIVGTVGIHLLFPHYTAALTLFYFLIALLPLHALKGISDSFLTLFRKQKFVFFRSVGRDVLKLGLLVLLPPLMGLPALPFIELILALLTIIGSYRYLLKRYPDFRMDIAHFFSYTPEDRALFAMLRVTVSQMVKKSLHL